MVTAAPRLDALDRIIEERIPSYGPGVAVAVIQDGQVIHSAGDGMASLEWSHPVSPDTVFGIGSTTKPFTATAIMLLERDGLLSTAAPITDYLPEHLPHLEAGGLAHMTGSYANNIGDAVEVTVEGDRLRATGELTADLVPISDTTLCAAHDADITVSFEDETASGFVRAKIVVPFYWYNVYRQPGGHRA
jgi:beta-lactamase family protein